MSSQLIPCQYGGGGSGGVLGHWPGWWYCLVHTSLGSCKFFSLIIQSASYSTMCTLCLLPFDKLFSEGGQMQEYYKVSVWSVQFLVQPLRQPLPLGFEAPEAPASFLVLVAITQTPFLSSCWPYSCCPGALSSSLKDAHFVNVSTICILFPRISGNSMGPAREKILSSQWSASICSCFTSPLGINSCCFQMASRQLSENTVSSFLLHSQDQSCRFSCMTMEMTKRRHPVGVSWISAAQWGPSSVLFYFCNISCSKYFFLFACLHYDVWIRDGQGRIFIS